MFKIVTRVAIPNSPTPHASSLMNVLTSRCTAFDCIDNGRLPMGKMTMTSQPKDSTGLILVQREGVVSLVPFLKHFHSRIVMFPYQMQVEMEKVLTVSRLRYDEPKRRIHEGE